MDFLVKNLLEIESGNHKEIQGQIKDILNNLGYSLVIEKKVSAKRPGYIDVFAVKDNYSIGIEIDRSSVRLKSIDKLNSLRPDLAIFILKDKIINGGNNYLRAKLIGVKSILIHLPKKKVERLK